MQRLLCDEAIINVRLKALEIKKPSWVAFIKLILFLKSDNGRISDYDLEQIWPDISRSTRYRYLKHFQEKKAILCAEMQGDKRSRYVSILIEYTDALYEVFVL